LQPENREECSPGAPFQNKSENRLKQLSMTGAACERLIDDAVPPVQTPRLFFKVGEQRLCEGCPGKALNSPKW